MKKFHILILIGVFTLSMTGTASALICVGKRTDVLTAYCALKGTKKQILFGYKHDEKSWKVTVGDTLKGPSGLVKWKVTRIVYESTDCHDHVIKKVYIHTNLRSKPFQCSGLGKVDLPKKKPHTRPVKRP